MSVSDVFSRARLDTDTRMGQSDKAAKEKGKVEPIGKMKRKNGRRRIEFSTHAGTVLNKRHTESSLKREAQVLISFLQRVGLKTLLFFLP